MSDYVVKKEYRLFCPYDQGHQITMEKLEEHLAECREAYVKKLAAEGQKVENQVCPFNPAHKVPQIELDFHELICQDSEKSGDVNGQDVKPLGAVKVRFDQDNLEAECNGNGCGAEQNVEVEKLEKEACDDKLVVSESKLSIQVDEDDEESDLAEDWDTMYDEYAETDDSDKYTDDDDFAGYDPYAHLQE